MSHTKKVDEGFLNAKKVKQSLIVENIVIVTLV